MGKLSPNTILVRCPNWIGDQILAFPFFYLLRLTFPTSRITAVCVPWVQDLQYRRLIDDLFILPTSVNDPWYLRFRTVDRLGRHLAQVGTWNMGIALPDSFAAAWLIYRAGTKRRVGYAKDRRRLLLNDPQKISITPQHRALNYLDLLPPSDSEKQPARKDLHSFYRENFGVPPISPDQTPTSYFVATSGHRDADPSILYPIPPPGVPYWIIAPGATAFSRRWPIEYFAELAKIICRQTGFLGVIVGSLAEKPLAEYLLRSSSLNLLDLTGAGSITRLIPVFSRAKFTVCNESGLAHLAAFSGSPTQIICGAANPQNTCPLGPGKVRVTFNPVACWPCERNFCDQPATDQIQCLRGITPEQVWSEITSALLGGPSEMEPENDRIAAERP